MVNVAITGTFLFRRNALALDVNGAKRYD